VNKLGDVKEVYVVGDFARGRDSRVIDLIFVGLGIDKEYLVKLVEKCENMIDRKIRYLVFNDGDYKEFLNDYTPAEILLLWKSK